MVSTSAPRRAVTAFPTTEESLALQASLLDGDRAVQAWNFHEDRTVAHRIALRIESAAWSRRARPHSSRTDTARG